MSSFIFIKPEPCNFKSVKDFVFNLLEGKIIHIKACNFSSSFTHEKETLSFYYDKDGGRFVYTTPYSPMKLHSFDPMQLSSKVLNSLFYLNASSLKDLLKVHSRLCKIKYAHSGRTEYRLITGFVSNLDSDIGLYFESLVDDNNLEIPIHLIDNIDIVSDSFLEYLKDGQM